MTTYCLLIFFISIKLPLCLVSQVMREATYPFLAILCMQDSRMMIVERIEAGLMDADNVLASLVNAVETNEPSLVAARVDRYDKQFAQ